MIWDYFIYFAIISALLWISGAITAWHERKRTAIALTSLGTVVFFIYIIIMWIHIERPPLRTMGETRLWYSLFLPPVGAIIYSRRSYRWILSFSTIMAIVFVGINIFKPEIHSKTLMPALQSPWFAPHVIVYMMAYALLGASALTAIYQLFQKCDNNIHDSATEELVYAGTAFLSLGMLMGALWAKEAWGHYWAWDPKETWAAITWFAYLLYLHWVRYDNKHKKLQNCILIMSFCLLQICWWGINYLPSAQNGASIHTYSME